MTYDQLIAELVERRALIVHCSTVAKVGSNRPLFPEDMLTAIALLDAGVQQLSCSVVWPDHQHSWGAVGIVVRPRSTASITSVKSRDAGSILDPTTGSLEGSGLPFSAQAVAETLEPSAVYNEWTVGNADCLGIFVNRKQPLSVAMRVPMKDVPGSDPSMWDADPCVGEVYITDEWIAQTFPGLSIFEFRNGELTDIHGRSASPYIVEGHQPPRSD